MTKFSNKWRKSNKSGFSLVELMVVVAIIGILAALAIPRFRTFQAKARQAEAKNNLMNIYTLQEAYHADFDKYVDLPAVGGNAANCGDDRMKNPLGFVISPCSESRYTYTVSGSSASGFVAHAKSGAGGTNKVLPGCPADEWTIDQNKNLIATNDVTRGCTN